MKRFIQELPKVELHLHIEGTLEPELMFQLAQRNQVEIPYRSVEDVRNAYQFHNLQSFLDVYYQGANVLLHEQDFYDLTWAYLLRCQQDKVMHTEIFFDPQTHTERGIEFTTVINGIHRALEAGREQLGISSHLIMCFLRHLDQASAHEVLLMALEHKEKIVAVGLDSSEKGNPPEKFQQVFEKAIEYGFLTVAHAGEEGPASNIEQALDLLKITRIDHGVRCTENQELVNQLVLQQTPLTVCPLSNTKLKVFEQMKQHNIVELLRKGVCVTINSDDPAYFGGYMNDNFIAVSEAFEMSHGEIAQFSFNAVAASFITESEKRQMRQQIEAYMEKFTI
ncbi:adenosine deaminase [Aliivibrio kagoshimensis]|uniref:adenosine deaminase n=1 Tax=Aliivibrio kagoshimensis TaxID=2910230 RepID=UPI003D13C339